MDALAGDYLLRTAKLPFVLKPDANCPCALVIVETRPLFFLPHVVATALQTHAGWHLYVFGTREVHALLHSNCNKYHLATRVSLPEGPMTTQQYSHLLLSPEFWGVLQHEHLLIFQADCVLVRPTPARYLEFDYIGALCGSLTPREFVMNGGLSLRRRSAMARAVSLMHASRRDLLDRPEDVALCLLMRAHNFCLPDMKACFQFAIESVGDPTTAIGLHGTDKRYAPRSLLAQLLSLVEVRSIELRSQDKLQVAQTGNVVVQDQGE